MNLRVRQIVLVARELEETVAQLTSVLGLQVCYRDPGVAKFGLVNALMPIGDQFLEVVSPTGPNTAAGRHLDRHGDSGYMLILQTDDLARDQERFDQLGVRIVWQSQRHDISAVHLHPKDIGGAIVSVDQPKIPADWPWAGPDWRSFVSEQGAQRVTSVTMGASDPSAMAKRWAQVLGTPAPEDHATGMRIGLEGGELLFEASTGDKLMEFGLVVADRDAALQEASKQGLSADGYVITLCGTRFRLLPA